MNPKDIDLCPGLIPDLYSGLDLHPGLVPDLCLYLDLARKRPAGPNL